MLRITKIPQAFRNVNRFREIIQVVVRHGFGDVLTRIGLDTALHHLTSRFRRRPVTQTTEVRIRLAIEELGSTFVKLGQIMATRPDLVPMSLILELRKLQDKVPPVPEDRVRAMLEAELGRPPAEVFDDFDMSPLAAASIGQVHRARLKQGGAEVVIKVQRPGLERLFETDLSIMHWLAELLVENIPELERYDPRGLVSEFEQSLLKEIDFEREASHMKRFQKMFAEDESIVIPRVYDEFTTSRVLCQEFIRGCKADDPEVLALPEERREALVRTGIDAILTQAFEHGFFHADPHPGNIFVVGDRKIALIDYGMIGVLDDERIDQILGFLVSVLTRDIDGIIRLFRRLELIDENHDLRRLRLDIRDLLDRYGDLDLGKVNIGRIITDLFEVITRHEVKIPSDLLLIGKALATIEGVGRQIYPDFEPLQAIRPRILEIYLKRMLRPGRALREPRRFFENSLDLLQSFPKDMRLGMRKLRDGDLVLNVSDREVGRVIKARDQAQNRLFLSIIVAALILGSSILLHSADILLPLFGIALKTAVGMGFLVLSILYGIVLIVGFFRSDGV